MSVELTVPVDGPTIASLIAVRDLLDAKLSEALGAFDAAGLWELDGDLDLVCWLRHQGGMDAPTARREARRARKLRSLPVTRQAFLDGQLTLGQVEVILQHVPERHLERFAEHESEIVPGLADLDVLRLRSAMTAWRAYADALDETPIVEHDNQVHLSATIDGRGELHGSFDADLHAVVAKALGLADAGDREESLAVRQAEALGTVCEFFLDNHQQQHGRRHRPHVNLTMTYEDWANREFATARYTETGQFASASAAEAICCDAAYHRVVLAGSAVLDYGLETRDWSTNQYNAILVRDGGCRWPGCDRPGSWCDIHHLDWWEHGGTTSIDNGALLCRRHHRLLHSKAGWRAKLLPDATLEITRPDGTTERSTPRVAWPPGHARAA